MTSPYHLDRFSALDDLPAKMRGDPRAVLSLLAKTGRFSTFEIEGKLCGTINTIIKNEWVTISGDYPWCDVTLTESGRAALRLTDPSSDAGGAD